MAGPSPVIPPSPTRGILFAEGRDDCGVLEAVLDHLGMKGNVEVRDGKGIQRTLAILETELLAGSATGTVGVVVDADKSAQSRWDSVKTVLMRAGYSGLARRPIPGGAIIRNPGRRTVGIWIMPDNTSAGALEEFARLLVPTGDRLLPEAEAAVQRAIAVERRFGPTHEAKAIIHTWLAWQAEPGRPMGQAITKRFLDPSSAHANALYAWLRALFP